MDEHVGREGDRGRDARAPREIPAPGWRDVLLRVREESSKDNLGLISAGVAYYGLLAIFPALAAMLSIYGLVADPVQVTDQIGQLDALPQTARQLLTDQLTQIASTSSGALTWSLVGGILLSIFSATKGINALIQALNIAYDEGSSRGFIKETLTGIVFTLGALLLAICAVAIVVLAPALLTILPLGPVAKVIGATLPWLLLTLGFMTGVAMLYRYGPVRERAEWHWITPGSLFATIAWVIASLGFSFYVSHFGTYNETYGSVGAVVVLLLWFYLTAYIIVLGAELNAELEHQTRHDTTTGGEQPMGERGAYVADTLGDVPR